jgi:hypothetical protein
MTGGPYGNGEADRPYSVSPPAAIRRAIATNTSAKVSRPAIPPKADDIKNRFITAACS